MMHEVVEKAYMVHMYHVNSQFKIDNPIVATSVCIGAIYRLGGHYYIVFRHRNWLRTSPCYTKKDGLQILSIIKKGVDEYGYTSQIVNNDGKTLGPHHVLKENLTNKRLVYELASFDFTGEPCDSERFERIFFKDKE